MKAVQLEKPHGYKKGDRMIVEVREVPVPTVGQDTVLVKILAAGMNRRDEWSALGLYPGLTFEHSTLGCDGCGVIVDPKTLKPESSDTLYLLNPSRGWEKDPIGAEAALPNAPDDITRNEFDGKGFAILGATQGVNGAGTFAEYIAVKRSQLVPAPKHLSAVSSASLPCAAVTAYRAAFTKANVKAGQNVLITGIGGGVALLALQLVTAAGANVYVTGGSSLKIDKAIGLGAKAGACYRDQDWPHQIRQKLPAERPYLDAVIDSAGGDINVQAISAGLRDGGNVAIYGMTAVPKTTFTMRDVLKNINVQVLGGLEHVQQGLSLLADAEKRSGGKVVIEIAHNTRATL
ncbi:propionate--CoA ligase [Malassezia psittaci]|uniref:Propionate--CoA ligase n=1 Tax=Malassezia psittaci TaxID=1821823 RepID=A0AAF0JDN7_9BASI|nr:propionate--CoA ligase [Malassezia psittaci]